MLVTLLILLAGPALLLYVVVPLVMRVTYKHSADPRFEQVGADAFPPEVAEDFARVAGSLAAQGFMPAAYVRRVDSAGATDTRALVLVNEATKESAVASDCVSLNPAVRVRQRIVEFCTEYVNGEEVCTHNSTVALVVKPHPSRRMYRFPSVRNPAALYGVHRRLVDSRPAPAERFIPTKGTEYLHVMHAVEKANRRQEEFGYLYRDGGVYRPTLKGAFLMTWPLLWPVKQVRESRARRSAAGLLRSLGG